MGRSRNTHLTRSGPGLHYNRRYSARAFWLVALTISLFTVYSFVLDLGPRYGHNGVVRGGRVEIDDIAEYSELVSRGIVQKRDQECRLVHRAKDKCAFVKANCPDEEAGLLSYLSLYYCRMPGLKPLAFTILVVWLGLLFTTIGIAASDFFCINLSTIATILGMSESMAGVTFLAFGNGSPDVFSTFAAMNSHSGSLAVGELIGAAGFITAVVAGSMALVRPFKVARKSFVRDVGFFIVAMSFSLGFLADGRLRMWECIVMIAFYIFYVVVVVLWHWWLGRRRRQRLRLAAAREPFHAVGSEELEREEAYHDDDEDGTPGERSRSRGLSGDDIGALERDGAESPLIPKMDEDEEDEVQERWLSDISSNMRVRRRPQGDRRSTVTPIRPSLVGALEFRAVLSSLQKARNLQTIPINLRRYSDDLYLSADHRSRNSEPDVRPTVEGDANSLNSPAQSDVGDLIDLGKSGHRQRAVSVNDAAGLTIDTSSLVRPKPPEIGLSVATPPPLPPGSRADLGFDSAPREEGSSEAAILPSPSLSLTPPEESTSRHAATSQNARKSATSNYLVPPSTGSYFPVQGRQTARASTDQYPFNDSPRTVSKHREQSRVLSPLAQNGSTASSPASPFPIYTESPTSLAVPGGSRTPSIRLPPPSISPESYQSQDGTHDNQRKPLKWWPYSVLPQPHILFGTLFPTLYTLPDKNIWEKFLGVVAAPAVFLLTITLPVVESEKDDDQSDFDGAPEGFSTPAAEHSLSRRSTSNLLTPESPLIGRLDGHWDSQQSEHQNHHAAFPASPSGFAGHGNAASLAVGTEFHHGHGGQQHLRRPSNARHDSFRLPDDTDEAQSTIKDWSRWLVCIQIILAPLFVVVVFWAGSTSDPTNGRTLLRPALIAILVSLVLLAILLITTSPTEPPKWRSALCFLGFLVSVAWISTIANEVVGVLKAFGVILGISDAILGLTIFAVGNSLGDLVADITVAKLGYPVMALSACFGGPMLNILLGIGISGLYMTLKEGAHRHQKYPDKAFKYKPFVIEVSSTIMISGVSLLITLLGLLVLVPLNGWKMDRRIGWGLIALWTISSAGNLVVEVTGWGGKVS